MKDSAPLPLVVAALLLTSCDEAEPTPADASVAAAVAPELEPEPEPEPATERPKPSIPAEKVELRGTVVEGSISKRKGVTSDYLFEVEHDGKRTQVHFLDVPPDQFQEGGEVLIEGISVDGVVRSYEMRIPQAMADEDPPAGAEEPDADDGRWLYWDDELEMGGRLRGAGVIADEAFELDSPYQGEQHAKLMVRQHPKQGLDIMFSVERGQLLCGYRDCYIDIRIDDEVSEKYSCSKPADGSSTMLFVRNKKKLLKKMKKAKALKVRAVFYRQGAHVFTFNVEGLDLARLKG